MLPYFSLPKTGMQLQANVVIGGRQQEKLWPRNGLKIPRKKKKNSCYKNVVYKSPELIVS
jgi:hypothetical protein